MRPTPGSVRSQAAWALDRVLATGVPADGILAEAAATLDARDARLLRELVLGAARWLYRIDAIIAVAASRRLASIQTALLAPLRLGVLQLVFLDRIPAHAAVDQSVREARRRTHRKGAGFVNAVLRRVAATPELSAWPVDEPEPLRRLAVETSHPDFLVRRWWNQFGEERTRELLAVNNRRKTPQVLAFKVKGGRDQLAARLAAEAVATEPSTLAPQGLVVSAGDPRTTAAWAAGSFYLQDVASQAAALVPAPRAGERVLDMAAAPGGKSFSLLAYQPELRVVAVDVNLDRLRLLIAQRDRLRVPLAAAVADGLRGPFGGRFDRVVLDLPCSGTGTFRKNPELKWRVSQREIDRLGQQGRCWVAAAADLVAASGVLVLITCSLEPEENAGVVKSFLERDDRFELESLAGRLPPSLESAVTGPGSWQVLPAGPHDGFTVHVLRRSDRVTVSVPGGSAQRDVRVAPREGRGSRSTSC